MLLRCLLRLIRHGCRLLTSPNVLLLGGLVLVGLGLGVWRGVGIELAGREVLRQVVLGWRLVSAPINVSKS